MATPVDVVTISAMVHAKVSLTTGDGVFTGVVHKFSNKDRIILTDVTCVNDRTEEPVSLCGMITIMAEEILDCDCLSLPHSASKPSSMTRLLDTPNPNEIPDSDADHRTPLQPSTSLSPSLSPQVASQCMAENVSTVNHSPDSKTQVSSSLPSSVQHHDHNGIDATHSNTSLLYARSIPFEDLALDDREYIAKRPSRYVVVENCGEMFLEAIDVIKSQGMIGVGFDGINLGRHGQLCWIKVSAGDIVILFDIVSVMMLDEIFDKGLREIFESKKILKILHDCRHSSDFLKHQFSVTLQNVYDTQVADIMVFRGKTKGMMPNYVRSLDAVLTEYVGLSKAEVAFYQVRKASLEKDEEIWRRRPQSSMLCEVAALSVRYFRELRLATLNAMMSDFTDGVSIYLDQRNSHHTYEEIDGDVKLPREFLKFGPVVGGRDVLADVRMRPSKARGQYVHTGLTTTRPGAMSSEGTGQRSGSALSDRLGPPDVNNDNDHDYVQQKSTSNVQFYPAGINMKVFEEDNRLNRDRNRYRDNNRNGKNESS